MRSSAISSATETSPSSATPPRKSFALTGPSRPLDPRINAVRPDIADVRLAEQVFAPHYAAPMPRRLLRDAVLRAERAADSAMVAELSAGVTIEVLDVTGGDAWGIADGKVGYLDAAAIGIGG